MLVDSHCHINFLSFKDDGDKVIADFLRHNYALIIVGSQDSSSVRAIEYADKYDRGVYAAVGLHPIDLIEDAEDSVMMDGKPYSFKSRQEDFDREKYLKMAQSSDKVKAIGEVGLDYYYFDKYSLEQIEEYKAKQAQVLREFISLAEELRLPLILHCRGTKENPFAAYDDLLKILKDELANGRKISGVVHCFGGSVGQAKEFLSLGLYIGITGIVTFKKKSEEIQLIAKETTLNRILIETDAPFLSPEPHRSARNIPAYVEFVARKIAELRKISFDEVAEATTENAKKLFNI
ncbi:MAG: TatD family hydrolase [Candidatus Buchananbacteria bacterium]|jgi:TatD DNase family protein